MVNVYNPSDISVLKRQKSWHKSQSLRWSWKSIGMRRHLLFQSGMQRIVWMVCPRGLEWELCFIPIINPIIQVVHSVEGGGSRWHFMRETVEMEQIELHDVKTQVMVADMLT